jgi:hypothetical protein
MFMHDLGNYSAGELLVLAADRAQTIQHAECELLEVAYQWAVLHHPARLDPAESSRPGREKARTLGGPGTPQVCEFAAAELGARIGRTTYAAQAMMADALDLHHRHPTLRARVEAGEVRLSYARHVVSKTRHLTEEQAGFVDAAVVESADGRIPWSRFEALVDAKVKQADPAAAREREVKAAGATFARRTRPAPDLMPGMASYLVHAPIPVIEQIDATVKAYSVAIINDHPDLTDDERDVRALLALLTPVPAESAGPGLAEHAPQVMLHVHTYAGADDAEGDPLLRLEGHGLVTREWVQQVLGPHARFTIQPVLDIAGLAPVDAYEIPDRHRRAVHLMTPADTFPWGTCTTRAQQIDHTVPYDSGGKSGIGNYGPMTAFHHRVKTHSGWSVRQPFPGIYCWRDPHGHLYLVDHTGTRTISGPGRPTPLVVEIYKNTPRIELGDAA